MTITEGETNFKQPITRIGLCTYSYCLVVPPVVQQLVVVTETVNRVTRYAGRSTSEAIITKTIFRKTIIIVNNIWRRYNSIKYKNKIY